VKLLVKHQIKAEAIHGNKAQNARQRALTNFKNKTIRVLVATDIAARGIDVDALAYVINFEIPNIPETYVHRIGRTGRAGLEGMAMSFCDHEEIAYLRDIEKLIKLQIPRNTTHPYPMEVAPKMDAPAPKKTQGSGGQRKPNPANQGRNNSNKAAAPKSNKRKFFSAKKG
jgi:ATP-dependent RNA helicase RhlE